MSDHEPNPIPEDEVDKAITDILHPYEESTADLDAFDSFMDQLNAAVVEAFGRIKAAYPELQFDVEEYLERCRNDLPVSDSDAEIFEHVATIVDDMPSGSAPELEMVAYKLKKATKIITTCDPQLQDILLKALDVVVPIEPHVHELNDGEIRLLNLAHNGGSPEREDEYSYIRILMRAQLMSDVEENLRAAYGEFDALHSVAYNLLNLGGHLGGIYWERYHTSDSPEHVRERNFQNALRELDVRKSLLFREGPLLDEEIDILLGVMKDLAVSYLNNHKGMHKE